MSNWTLKFKKRILFIVRLKRMRYLDINLTKICTAYIYMLKTAKQMKPRRSNKSKALFQNLSVKRDICNPLLLTFCCIIFPVFLGIYLV